MPLLPSLYGLTNSNRSNRDHWGKNQFNSSFPASLACYMRDNQLPAGYLKLNNDLSVSEVDLPVCDVFNSYNAASTSFQFESKYLPYQQYSNDDIGSIDLVIKEGDAFKRALEVKLTVLPDSTTCNEDSSDWGTEIVIRPASTKYCVLSIVDSCRNNLQEIRDILEPVCLPIRNWDNHIEILHNKNRILDALDIIQTTYINNQIPFLLQPIWRTNGSNPDLDEHAFDLFVWSNFALCRTFLDSSRREVESVNRYMRSSARLAKVLYDISSRARTPIQDVYTTMTFDLQSDKEFALSGKTTRTYMDSNKRRQPRLPPEVLRSIILNGGENLLSPERRFDATIFFTAKHLFEYNQDIPNP